MTVELAFDLKRWLVERGEEIAKTAASKARDGDRNVAQLRNLLQISQTESDVRVLANFIRYQAARRATKSFWEPIYVAVVAVLEEIAEKRATASDELRKAAIQHFLGYLIRGYVYETAGAKSPKKGGGHG